MAATSSPGRFELDGGSTVPASPSDCIEAPVSLGRGLARATAEEVPRTHSARLEPLGPLAPLLCPTVEHQVFDQASSEAGGSVGRYWPAHQSTSSVWTRCWRGIRCNGRIRGLGSLISLEPYRVAGTLQRCERVRQSPTVQHPSPRGADVDGPQARAPEALADLWPTHRDRLALHGHDRRHHDAPWMSSSMIRWHSGPRPIRTERGTVSRREQRMHWASWFVEMSLVWTTLRTPAVLTFEAALSPGRPLSCSGRIVSPCGGDRAQ